jgi:hypothetical protein
MKSGKSNVVIVVLLMLFGVFFPIEGHTKTQVYTDFPVGYRPASPTQHPRIYIQNRIPALKTLYNTVPQLPAVSAFKHDIDKLLTYTSACQDWRCENGWPAAALALHWLLTGNSASGQKACDVFIPYFNGTSPNNQGTDLYYALAYDWLFHHPCFTDAMKASLRTKLVSWSDDTAFADEAGSWTAHDSDRNIAATSGHFIGGLAILGEDEANGLKLLKRGWTGWKYGINANGSISDFPVVEFFRASLDTGIPLPGWDYGMMSDLRMAQNLYYVLDELGIIDAEFPDLKQWWVNSMTYFMHSVDPANTHYRWIGDQQNTVALDPGGGKYIWSYFSNCVFLAERYGHTTEAAIGRSFLDALHHPSYGISEGDTMLWFMTSWPTSAKRTDFKTSAKRYVLGGFGSGQHMGMGMFRSNWASGTSFSDPSQVTWGGFYGIGSYPVDHMHNNAGSFWLWRNGEYLLTEPLNYGGNEAAVYPFTLWNSLSIPNEAVPNSNESHDNGGPIVYFNQNSAYLVRGKAEEKENLFYALLNADYSYNVPENIWATCKGTCRQPVSKYTRSFVYDGTSEVVFLVDRVDLARTRPVGVRFRTQNPHTLSTLVSDNIVSVPSDKGNYRTLIRVLTPTTSADPWVIAQEPWSATVPSWQIDPSMIGSQARKNFATALQHRIVTVLQMAKSSEGNTALNDAGMIMSAPESIGACALSFCFVTPYENLTTFRASVNYTTPATMPANARHLVTDLDANGCYSVTSSLSGTISGGLTVSSSDHTLLFVVPAAGAQGISIVKTAGANTCVDSASTYTVPGTLANDVFVLTAGNSYYGGGGNDTFIISHNTLRDDVTARIIDSEGDNTIQLVDSLSLTGSTFYADAAQLTLSNGAKVQILGASKFKYQIGANLLAGDTATVLSYAEFVTALGASLSGTLPASGTPGYTVPTAFTQASLPTPSVAGVAYTVPGTLSNDVLAPSGGNNYLGGGGNDTYIISPYTLSGAVTAKIIDTEGSNVIQLVKGMTIASSSFYANALQLTLSNGASVQILGASGFSYQLGANAPAGETASSLTYAQFAVALGASVPTGSTPVSGSANFVVQGSGL